MLYLDNVIFIPLVKKEDRRTANTKEEEEEGKDGWLRRSVCNESVKFNQMLCVKIHAHTNIHTTNLLVLRWRSIPKLSTESLLFVLTSVLCTMPRTLLFSLSSSPCSLTLRVRSSPLSRSSSDLPRDRLARRTMEFSGSPGYACGSKETRGSVTGIKSGKKYSVSEDSHFFLNLLVAAWCSATSFFTTKF